MTEEQIHIDRNPQRTATLAGIKAATSLLETFANSTRMDAFDLTYPQPTISCRWVLRGLESDINVPMLTESIRTLNLRGPGTLHISYQTPGHTTLGYGFVQVYDNPYDDAKFRYATCIDVGTISHDKIRAIHGSLTEDPDAERMLLGLLGYIDSLAYITGYYSDPSERLFLASLCA